MPLWNTETRPSLRTGCPSVREKKGMPIAEMTAALLGVSLAAPSTYGRLPSAVCRAAASMCMSSSRDKFNLLVLGDLHLEDDMTGHHQARDDCLDALKKFSLLDEGALEKLQRRPAGELSRAELQLCLDAIDRGALLDCHLASLGDVGRKDIRHEAGDPGTSQCFADAKSYLDSFNLEYSIISGNHDLEGLDEFADDESNLGAWLRCFEMESPYWTKEIAEKTLLVGLSTTRFRDAPFSSHEVHISDEQIAWLRRTLESHPADKGWHIIVLSHAPPMGSGLRALQDVHVRNGCAWLNHCGSEAERRVFLELVHCHPGIRMWLSGHFHLSHDFEDSISHVANCAFVQVGVMGTRSTRDGKRQSRLIRGGRNGCQIYTINHHAGTLHCPRAHCIASHLPLSAPSHTHADSADDKVRLDAHVDFTSNTLTFANPPKPQSERSRWFRAYTPRDEDGCYMEDPNGLVACSQSEAAAVCWWHMEQGQVLGVHDGVVVEYDEATKAPLGIVVERDELRGRQVAVVNNGAVLVLLSGESQASGVPEVEVIQPNDDGSYWRRKQANKMLRQQRADRERIAKAWFKETFGASSNPSGR